MQLTRKNLGQISSALGLMTASLLAANAAHAQTASGGPAFPLPLPAPATGAVDDTVTDAGLTRIDSSVLFYAESGGRVKATEPVVSATLNSDSGDVLTMRFTADALTGATPNGAAPWKAVQTFITPAQAPGSTKTVTSASGGSTIVTIPGTGTVARQYTSEPNSLPVDSGFKDMRYALDLGYSDALSSVTRLNFGGSASLERDYGSYSASVGITQDFNQKRTTASLSLNTEYDQSDPRFGTPDPLTVMSALQKGSNGSKTVLGLVAGVTEVVNRYWLTQLNYSYGTSNGYMTDPYRVISVVDPITGGPVQYLYESRPNSRVRQSLYWANKVALGPTFLDFSARAYHDSWGITSTTIDMSDRVPFLSQFYIEPGLRYYHQTAASFFQNYLLSGQPLPDYASSDSRLDQFSAKTFSLKAGFKLDNTTEFYVLAQDYVQTGNSHPAGAPGNLANQNLLAGVKALSVVTGFSFAFY